MKACYWSFDMQLSGLGRWMDGWIERTNYPVVWDVEEEITYSLWSRQNQRENKRIPAELETGRMEWPAVVPPFVD